VELSLRSGDQGGECKVGDLPYMEGPPSCAALAVLVGPPLAQRYIKKGGTPEHENQRSPRP
jgi:hypothetical protein